MAADDSGQYEVDPGHRTIFITRQIRHFEDDYVKLDPLGQGQFGLVYKCYRRNDRNQTPYAVKEIYKSKMAALCPTEKDALLSAMQNEIAILLKLRHRNIVQLFDVYESRDQLHLVMEYLPGGELYDRICRYSDGYGEKQAAKIIKQILEALRLVHSRKILHLDLKPENILFASDDDECVKLIDFGVSQMVPRLTLLKGKKMGTTIYMAPEVIRGDGVGYGADVWSVGVILYAMIFGYPPFFSADSSDEAVEQNILKGFDASIKDGYGAWFPSSMPITAACMKLLRMMLQTGVAKRWTVDECLSSKWIQEHEHNEHKISPLLRDSLVSYNKCSKFRSTISNLFSDYLDADVKQEIQRHFSEMDLDKNGVLTLDEFKQGLRKLNENLSNEQIESIFESLDFDGDLTLSLSEIINSTNFRSMQQRDERLFAAFEQLDSNKDGKLSIEEMEAAAKNIMQNQTEMSATLKRLKSAFNEADTDKNGFIEYDEFLKNLHPEFKDEDSLENISRQKTVEDSFDAPQFNVTRSRKYRPNQHLILRPHTQDQDNECKDNAKQSQQTSKQVESLKEQISVLAEDNKSLTAQLKRKTDELMKAKNVYVNNIQKVHQLQMELQQKDEIIKSLTQNT